MKLCEYLGNFSLIGFSQFLNEYMFVRPEVITEEMYRVLNYYIISNVLGNDANTIDFYIFGFDQTNHLYPISTQLLLNSPRSRKQLAISIMHSGSITDLAIFYEQVPRLIKFPPYVLIMWGF